MRRIILKIMDVVSYIVVAYVLARGVIVVYNDILSLVY